MPHADNVIGFGAHMPDFIKVEVKLPPLTEAKTDSKTEEVEETEPFVNVVEDVEDVEAEE